jgi:hypothetical protein
MLPASILENSAREAYAEGHQTAETGKTKRIRASAEASAHVSATKFTRRFSDYNDGPSTESSNTLSLHRNPYLNTHFSPGVAELQCNHPLMCSFRSSTRAERASAVRFLFLFRRILQVRIILQIRSHRVPERTQIHQKQHLPAPILPLSPRIDSLRAQPVLSTRRREIKTRRDPQQGHESVMEVGPSIKDGHALARDTTKGSAVPTATTNQVLLIGIGKIHLGSND